MQNLSAAATSFHLTQANENLTHSTLILLKLKGIDDEIEKITQNAKEKGIDIHNTSWMQEIRALRAKASQQMHLLLSFGSNSEGLDHACEKAFGELNQIRNQISAGISKATDVHLEAGKAHHQFQSLLKTKAPELLCFAGTTPLLIHKNSENDEFEKIGKKAQLRDLSRQVGNYGRGYSRSTDFLAELILESDVGESDNPIRDMTLHASVNIGFGVLGPMLIGGPYGMAASLGTRIVGQIAKEMAETVDPLMEEVREKVAPFEDFDALAAGIEDRPSLKSTTYIASGILRVAQMPADAVKFAKQQLGALAVQGCDGIGLTEANMLKAIESTAKYDSQNMLEAVMMEDKVTPEATFEALKEAAYVVGEAMSKFHEREDLP